MGNPTPTHASSVVSAKLERMFRRSLSSLLYGKNGGKEVSDRQARDAYNALAGSLEEDDAGFTKLMNQLVRDVYGRSGYQLCPPFKTGCSCHECTERGAASASGRTSLRRSNASFFPERSTHSSSRHVHSSPPPPRRHSLGGPSTRLSGLAPPSSNRTLGHILSRSPGSHVWDDDPSDLEGSEDEDEDDDDERSTFLPYSMHHSYSEDPTEDDSEDELEDGPHRRSDELRVLANNYDLRAQTTTLSMGTAQPPQLSISYAPRRPGTEDNPSPADLMQSIRYSPDDDPSYHYERLAWVARAQSLTRAGRRADVPPLPAHLAFPGFNSNPLEVFLGPDAQNRVVVGRALEPSSGSNVVLPLPPRPALISDAPPPHPFLHPVAAQFAAETERSEDVREPEASREQALMTDAQSLSSSTTDTVDRLQQTMVDRLARAVGLGGQGDAPSVATFAATMDDVRRVLHQHVDNGTALLGQVAELQRDAGEWPADGLLGGQPVEGLFVSLLSLHQLLSVQVLEKTALVQTVSVLQRAVTEDPSGVANMAEPQTRQMLGLVDVIERRLERQAEEEQEMARRFSELQRAVRRRTEEEAVWADDPSRRRLPAGSSLGAAAAGDESIGAGDAERWLMTSAAGQAEVSPVVTAGLPMTEQ